MIYGSLTAFLLFEAVHDYEIILQFVESYVSHNLSNLPVEFVSLQKAPIDPFTRESCRPSASQGVPLGGMGYAACQIFLLKLFVVIPLLV